MTSNERRVVFDESKVDEVFAEFNQAHLPGVAVGVAIDGIPVYRKGFGLANLESSTVLSPSTRMRIGSTTKHFTSLAYLLLCEEGCVELDDPVGKYLPGVHPVSRRATMRQLMGHVSGLRDPFEVCFAFSGFGGHVARKQLLGLFDTIDDVNCPPSTTWSYNNGGYLLISEVIERVSGELLEEFFRTRLFEPIGMYDTLLRRWDHEYLPNSAALHYRGPSGTFVCGSLGVEFDGAGGIVSSVDDMLRWLAHMGAPTIGGAASWKAIHTPMILLNGTSTGYGLGMSLGHYRGFNTVQHSGGVLGGNSQMLKVPSAGLDLVVLANRSDVSSWELAFQVLDVCLPGSDRRKPVAAAVGGIFCSSATGRVVELFERGGRQFAAVNGIEAPIGEDEDGIMWIGGASGPRKQGIVCVGDRERPESIQFTDYGASENLAAVEPPVGDSFGNVEGRYRSESTGTDAVICAGREGVRLETFGRFGHVEYKLQAIGEGFWRIRGPWELGGTLRISAGADRVEFSTTRTTRLVFHRVE